MKNIKKRVKNLIKKYGTSNPYKLCKYLNIEIFYMDLGNVKGIYKKTLTKYTTKIEIEANIFTSELMYDENIEDYEYDLDIDIKILEQLKELRNL